MTLGFEKDVNKKLKSATRQLPDQVGHVPFLNHTSNCHSTQTSKLILSFIVAFSNSLSAAGHFDGPIV
jgi:hypothetical protein